MFTNVIVVIVNFLQIFPLKTIRIKKEIVKNDWNPDMKSHTDTLPQQCGLLKDFRCTNFHYF